MGRFDEMQTFVRVVEAGGITAAAERLGVAKSVVSRRLKELEGRLDAQLLQRTTRRIHLTDAGRDFYPRCLRILEELDEAEQSLSSQQQTLGGRLRINAPLSLGIRHLTPALQGFNRLHPAVDFDIQLDDREVNLVEEGVDVLLRVGRLEDSSLVARRLCEVAFGYFAAPAYLARHGTPHSPAELAGHIGIGYSLVPDARLWHFAQPDATLPSFSIHTNNGDMILAVAEAGMGIARLPTFISHRAVAEGRLLPLLQEHPTESLGLYALYSSRQHLPRRVRSFIEYLSEWFGAGAPWERDGRDG